MVNNHVKRGSISLVIREMKIKATMRYHSAPTRVAVIIKKKRKMKNNKCWLEDVKKFKPHRLLVGIQNSAAAVEDGLEDHQKVKHRITI